MAQEARVQNGLREPGWDALPPTYLPTGFTWGPRYEVFTSETDIVFSVFDAQTNKVAAFQIPRRVMPTLGLHLDKLAEVLRKGIHDSQ